MPRHLLMLSRLTWLGRTTGANGRRLLVALPLVWLALFFLLPLLKTLQVSFTTAQRSVPPYAPDMAGIVLPAAAAQNITGFFYHRTAFSAALRTVVGV